MASSLTPAGTKQLRRFRRLGIAAIVSVYLVILAGGIVRMTGSGMGCPDWPKCFGQWVPPTHVSQLPADYQQRFDLHGHGVDEFNAAKTWTEYINRTIGALSGLVILVFAVYSLPFLRKKGYRYLSGLAVFTLLLMGFQGWLGSVVVSTNLAPYMVTIHMLVAILIVCLLVLAVALPRLSKERTPLRAAPLLRSLAVGGFLVILFQTALGTQLREAIDTVAEQGNTARDNWVSNAGGVFYVHRSFSWLVVILTLVQWWFVRKSIGVLGQKAPLTIANALLAIMLAEVALGILLANAGLPAFAQPLHLLFASLLAGLQFALLILVFRQFQPQGQNTISNETMKVSEATSP